MFSKAINYLKERTQNGNFAWRTLGFLSSGFYNMTGLRLFFNLKKLAGVDHILTESNQIDQASNLNILSQILIEFKRSHKMFVIFSSITFLILFAWLILTIMGLSYFGAFNYYLLVYAIVFSLLAYQQYLYYKKLYKRLKDLKK